MPVNSFENYPMSWKPVFDKTKKPLYRTLAKQLEEDILNGSLLRGTKLPPQRELADFLDINVSTVSKAFKVCELKGFLSATVGSGTFVSYDALSGTYLYNESKSTNLIEMGATVPENFLYESVFIHLKEMMNEANFAKWFSYSKQEDTFWQKDAALKLMRKGGFHPNIHNILFANGAQNAITATLASICKYGDKIGTDPHTYSGLKTSAAMLGIQLVPIKLEDGEMSKDALRYACKNENLKGIYLIPDYQNPTTHIMSIACREAIAQVAIEYNIFIIEDATNHLLSKEPLEAVANFAPDQTIYIASLSKLIAPGLRIAYVFVPNQYKKLLSDALYNLNICVSPLLSDLAARFILSNNFDKVIDDHRESMTKRNQLVNTYLSDYECYGDETSIFRWLQLPENCSGAKVEALALEQGVQIYAAERFTIGNSIPQKAVRLAICAPKTLVELKQGLCTLKKLLESL